MVDYEFSKTPPELVSPSFVDRIAYERIQKIDTESITLTEAKRVILELAMLTAVSNIIDGKHMPNPTDRDGLYGVAEGWLVAIDKTNNNDWTELVDKMRLNTMVIEDSDFGSHEAAEKIYKLIDLISDSPQGFK